MSEREANNDPVLQVLRPLLGAQHQRLRARFFAHGVSITSALVLAALLFAFGLDRWLFLPLPIRLLHSLALVSLLGYGAVRFVRYPLSRRFADHDLAVWFERTFPTLHQRLVSAIQLHAMPPAALRNQSPAMIERLLEETAAAVQALPLQQLFDSRRTRRFAAAALLLALVTALGALWYPATTNAFVWRHLGFAVDYPRATTLRLELPPAGADLQRSDQDGLTELVLPAGADLHVSVLAIGTVPKEVWLDVRTLRAGRGDEPRSVSMTPRPGDRFRHVFRRLAGDFEFHARGGDDEHGDRRVVVRTVHPPQVATLSALVTPPAYTGAAAVTQSGGAIEGLIGAEVELSLTTTAPVTTAALVLLESGRRIELGPVAPQDDSGAATVYRARFRIEGSDRYQCELIGGNGLRNPDPGTYPIAALQDYAPVGRWLLPDEAIALLPTGLLCVRLEAKDDFGLVRASLQIERAGQTTLQQELLAAALPGDPATAAAVTSLLPTTLFEVKDLLGGAAAENDSLVLHLRLADNRQPEPGATELPRRIVPIVDPPQLAAIIGRQFRGLREEVAQAVDVQRDRLGRLQDLLARTGQPTGEFPMQLTGIEVGQGRIRSATERVHLGLMRAFDLHLWNRLETSQNADKVVQLFVEHGRTLREAVAADPAFYRDLAARRAAGTLGEMPTTLDPILNMVQLADVLTSTRAPALARLLAEAQVARDAERAPLLQRAEADQAAMLADLEQLLLRLEEWNDYQDMVQEVRALRDKQRELQSRTEEARGRQ
ncbi:MAG: hypothetical protein JNN13_15430 [Planctomycetes bacterium]|nr:hypothetical protein [Planctomycetota bacterium]